MVNRLVLLALALLCCASLGQGLTTVNEVDPFLENSQANSRFFFDTFYAPGFFSDSVSLPAVTTVPIGGASPDRDSLYAAQISDNFSQVSINLNPTFSALAIELGNGAAWVAVDYDGLDGTPAVPTSSSEPDVPGDNPTDTGLNATSFFTDGNAVGVTYRVEADHAVLVEIHLYEQGNPNASIGDFSYPEPPSGTSPSLFTEINYADFSDPSINFSGIGALRILVFTTVATDFQMDTFFTFTNEISGRVYVDCNESFDDEGETAVVGYPVQLFQCGSITVFDSTLTDVNGNYDFGVADTLGGNPACYDVCIDTGSLSANGLIFEPNGAPSSGQTCYSTITTFDSADNDFGITDTVIGCSDAFLDCADSIGSEPTNTGDATSPSITTLGPCTPTFTFTDFTQVPGTCNGQVSRTFTTSDSNAATCTQQIFITDNAGPTLDSAPPANVPLDCSDDTSVAANGGDPTFIDNCNGVSITGPVESSNTPCTGTIQLVRTWESEDFCGTPGDSFTQTITTTDTTDPDVMAPDDFVGNCNSVATVGIPTGTDDCSSVMFQAGNSFTDSAPTSGPCGQTFIRTWTGVDDCGNIGSDTQLITLADTEAPTLTAPGDETVSCIESTAEADTGTISNIDDDCSTVTILRPPDSTSVINSCTTEITRTWIAQDTCSTTSDTTVTQVITVIDNILPTLTLPPPLPILACTASIDPEDTGMATAFDNCQGTLTPSITSETAIGDSCITTISRTWTVTDNCAGEVSDTQTIVLDDNQPPTFTVPASNSNLECTDSTFSDVRGEPTNIVDDCSGTRPATFSDVVTGDGCSQTYTRRWFVSDDCSNLSPAQTQTLVFTDTIPPTVTAPADVTLQCGDDESATTGGTGVATVSDSCNTNVIVPTSNDSEEGNSCSRTITRTWTASDGCLVGSSVQTIVVNDNLPPTITVPAEETVELCTCGSNCGTAATASDDCQSSVSLTFLDTGAMPGECGTVTRTWTADDGCGMTDTAVQTITFIDSTPPVYDNNLVDPVNLECGADTSPLATGIAAFSDCTLIIVTMVDVTLLSDDCDQQYERRFFGTNACGGQSVFTQTINVADRVAPTFVTFPPTASVECSLSTDPTQTNGLPTATDACQDDSSVLVTFSDVEDRLDSCTEVITRTWTIVDICGNSRTQNQSVNVVDTTRPTISIPLDVLTECTGGAPGTYTGFGTATGSDACDPTSIVATFLDDPIISGTACLGVFDRTWTVTDTCGLSTSGAQQFQLEDTTAPVFNNFPGTSSINCGDSSDPIVTGEPDVIEACNSFVLTFDDSDPSTNCPATVARTWSVDDGCNGPTSSIQILIVNDSLPPTFTNFPSDMNNLQCGASTDPAQTGEPRSSDSCTTASTPIFSDDTVATLNNCFVTISRTWSTTDSCANTFTQVQTLTYADTIAPPVDSFPTDSTIECGAGVPAPSATVGADACSPGTESVVVLSETQTGVCTQFFSRVYLFSDSCSNSFTQTETVTIVDTTPPTIGTVPDTTVDCDDTRPVVLPSATDCDNIPSVTFSDVETADNCPNDSIVRTFTATDWCGATSQSITTITVTNNLPPSVQAPAAETVECGDSSDPSETGEPTVTHPCDLGFTVTFSDSSNGGDSCSELITRSWIASDICGNTGSAVQILDISDNIEPTFTCFPEDVSVLCSESTEPSNTGGFPCATDDCQGVVCQISFFDSAPTELTPVGDCPGDLVYIRTWLADDSCGMQVSQNQLITVIFHEQAEDCPADPCVAAPCELCECPVEPPCNCCAMGGITACTAVPCNAVECTPVACTAVDCLPCPASSGTTVSPAQPCGPEVPCIPNLRFVHNNDDGDGEQRSTYVVDFGSQYVNDDDDDDNDNNGGNGDNGDNDDDSASMLAGSFLAVLLPIVVLVFLN